MGADGVFFDGTEFSNALSVQLNVQLGGSTLPACTAHIFVVYDKVLKVDGGILTYTE